MQQDSDDLGEWSEVGGGCSAPRGSVGALGPSANLLQSHKAPFPAPTPGPLVVVCSSSLRAGCVGHSGEWRRVVGRRRHTYTHTRTHTRLSLSRGRQHVCLPWASCATPLGSPWAGPGLAPEPHLGAGGSVSAGHRAHLGQARRWPKYTPSNWQAKAQSGHGS